MHLVYVDVMDDSRDREEDWKARETFAGTARKTAEKEHKTARKESGASYGRVQPSRYPHREKNGLFVGYAFI